MAVGVTTIAASINTAFGPVSELVEFEVLPALTQLVLTNAHSQTAANDLYYYYIPFNSTVSVYSCMYHCII